MAASDADVFSRPSGQLWTSRFPSLKPYHCVVACNARYVQRHLPGRPVVKRLDGAIKTSSGLVATRRGLLRTRCQAGLPPEPKVSPALAGIPMLLTYVRVLAIPALIAAWWSPASWAAAAVTSLFIGASVTDFLDGYLARKWEVTSSFGAFLDPVADKLMVGAVLVLLATAPIPAGGLAGNVWLMPLSAIVMISREITMSAIREWAASLGDEARSAAAVSWMGKWKTASQMVSLALLLYARQAGKATAHAAWAADSGAALLVVAVALTVASLVDYSRALAKYMV